MNRLRTLRTDHFVRGSFFLMLSTAVTAALGFAFWLVVARLYAAPEVGLMTSLISATSLLSYLSLLGLNSTIVRFLPESKDGDRMVTTAIAMVFLLGLLVATAYVLGLPLYAPKLDFVRHDTGYAFTFVTFTAFVAVNLFTDSVFIAKRATQFNVLVDGFLQGGTKLVLPLALVGIGSFAIFASYGAAAVVAVIASLFLMKRKLAIRLRKPRLDSLSEVLHFSIASYISSVLNLAPTMVLPLIVLNKLGAADAAYYFVAFQIANLLNAVSYAVGEALFAEGSQPGVNLIAILRKSGRVLGTIQVPATVVVGAISPIALRVFGHGYAQNGTGLLIVLALGALAVAVNTWSSFLLKLTHQMRALIWSNVVYATVTVTLAFTWSSFGLAYVGLAWDIGNLTSGAFALLALVVYLRREKQVVVAGS